MEKSDIKHALKTVKEYEAVGSFVMGMVTVGVVFAAGVFALQKLKFQPFGFINRDKAPVVVISPTPTVSEMTELPASPKLYQKNDQWYVEGLPAIYTVKAGDSSWKVALAVYGSGDNYKDIEIENNLLPNQDLVVGQRIKIPDVPTKSQVLLVTTIKPTQPATPTQASKPTSALQTNQKGNLPTKHVVKKSEGLWQIAQQYYNDGYKYMKIFEANRDKMKTPEDINEGMELTIPQL